MDSTNDERKKLQHQQMREWCAALQQEKQSAAAAERNADRQYYQMQGEITSSLNEMISAHEDSKQQLLFTNAAENPHPSASIQSRADPYIFICSTLVLYGTYGLTKFSMPQFYFFHWNLLTNYILNLVSPLRYYRKY